MSFDHIFGGFMLCYPIGSIFYGLTVAQAYAYFNSCQKDPSWMKGLAGIVLALESMHTIVYLQQMFFYLVPSESLFWSIPATYVLQVIIEMIVDGFYIYRMWTPSRNTILVVAAVQIFLGRNVTFLYWIAQKHDTFSSTVGSLDDSRSTHDTLLITTCLAIGLDIIMAATMVYYLQQNKPEIQRSRGMINWLVIYYVNTGAILASLSIATLVVAHYPVTFPSNLFMGLQNIFAKVMANSFFGVLNSRQLLRAKMETPVVVGPNVFGFVRRSSSFGSIPVRIEISKETTEMIDDV